LAVVVEQAISQWLWQICDLNVYSFVVGHFRQLLLPYRPTVSSAIRNLCANAHVHINTRRPDNT
jgi:hypothetical protein